MQSISYTPTILHIIILKTTQNIDTAVSIHLCLEEQIRVQISFSYYIQNKAIIIRFTPIPSKYIIGSLTVDADIPINKCTGIGSLCSFDVEMDISDSI